LRSHSAPDLQAQISALDERQEHTERDQRVRDIQRKRKQGRDRRANIRLLESRRDAIASGVDIDALISAWSLVADSAVSKRGVLNLNRLRIRVGNDLVEVFQRGFVACWRKQSAVLPEAGSNKTVCAARSRVAKLWPRAQVGEHGKRNRVDGPSRSVA
jgi:hypothetical protein